ncbi:hypothetical protein AAC03nite_07300 [Alicyclobacillus acidoterrestris]|uniref:TlpA family protein disulfide reductase n=1 Tax=Alicyclobacillus suci TaxID=2816080 RepID=UPI001193737C|nr:thioredoxin [Alicyclobacillus suci]GEO24945.1 hypothetical protein AAC03nite_07300 [Alicyclobacillus acidoterrestris]
MNRLAIGISTLAVCLLMTGCAIGQNGASANQTGTTSGQLVFQNKTSEMRITPDKKMDASLVTTTDDTHIDVLDSQGHRVILNAEKTPALIVAYWCPHCQRTLQLLSNHQSQLSALPVLIHTGFPDGTTLAEAKKVVATEVKDLHLHGFTSYYALGSSFAKQYAPKGYPTLLYGSNEGVQSLVGEHVFSVWDEVLTTPL